MHPNLFTSLSTSLLLAASATIAFDHVSVAAVGTDNPPFSWEEGYATPGASLQILEVNRQQHVVDFRLKAKGFDNDHDLLIWFKRGQEYASASATLDKREIVRIAPEDLLRMDNPSGPSYRVLVIYPNQDRLLKVGLFFGESVDIALWDPVAKRRSQAKVIPFPIESKGSGTCSGSAELIDRDPRTFLIKFTGFTPGGSVQVNILSPDSETTETFSSSERGEVLFHLRTKKGDVKLTATDGSACVTLEFVAGIYPH